MKKSVVAGALSLAVLSYAAAAGADETVVRFKGGIGVIPVSAPTTPNTVRDVPPAGQPWVIEDLRAEIKTDGSIKVDGRGLLLAGGNRIGTNANARVFATLFCGTVEHSTTLTGVALEVDGDFRIDDMLTPVPPAECATPVLLIRTANGGGWFAAGIPKL
jgi:hypothetical protein